MTIPRPCHTKSIPCKRVPRACHPLHKQYKHMQSNETIYTMALTRLNHFSLASLRELLQAAGSATAIIDHRHSLTDILPQCPPRIIRSMANLDEAIDRAHEEREFCTAHGIEVLRLGHDGYPQRLAACHDAPLVLFYKGTANLNRLHIVSVVGTRRCTAYGQDVIQRFISELKMLCPEALVVSGLAYGVDICAHRQALASGLDTVGVLAHGLDYLYPPRHRDTAVQMVAHGGLLTEFFTNTNADKVNFVRRNRIVAGMADATLLAESAAHGGGLITARLAREYGREVFAVPGRLGDKYSEGCNNIILERQATMFTSAAQMAKAMGWHNGEDERQKPQHIELQLFPDLSPDEQAVARCLAARGDMQADAIATQTGIAIGRLSATLFALEMKGMVKPLAGATYHLIK